MAELAWGVQHAIRKGDYATVCALLSLSVRPLPDGGESCADAIEELATRRQASVPALAWVRLRGSWGSVVFRRRHGGLALTRVERENGAWRFSGLEFAGADWP